MKPNFALSSMYAIILSCSSLPAIAQEETQVEQAAIVIEATQEGDGQPMQIMSFSTSNDGGAFFMSSDLAFSPAGFGSDPYSMLSNKQVQDELNLVGEQLEQYKAMQDDYQSRIKERMGDLKRGNFDPAKAGSLKETIQTLEMEKQAAMEGLLLPQQLNRLKQISLQQRIKNGGANNTLRDKEVMEKVGLTDEDVEQLQKKADELNEKLQVSIEKMRADMQKELLGTLTKEQQSKLEELRGEAFDYQPERPMFGPRRLKPKAIEKSNDK